MGYIVSVFCWLSISIVASAVRQVDPSKPCSTPMLLAFACVIRFTSLAGTRTGGAYEHARREADQSGLSPDQPNLNGACHEI
jgi:hypothetical protein